ncbi:arginase family protein [Cytobacillus sp. Hz8]|uniref:arginase family protein n=1 Tax=Cytobacillus sp. Hz8 TaxID=3347168 RepID=UPI0035DAFD57
MGLLKQEMSIIHFDETYFAQKKLQAIRHENMDFRQVEHVDLYCEKASLETIEGSLNTRRQKGITFIGSGNYHYVTYLLLKEIQHPFTLILFDNHPDLGNDQQEDQMLISCGSWVSHALANIPFLEKVVIIGPTTIMPHQLKIPRVSIFPFDIHHNDSKKKILSAIQSENVYISIDKDVLNAKEVVTNWDQGRMDTLTLIHYLEDIISKKETEGVDICGEIHLSPLDSLLPDYQESIQMNERANLQILQTCLKFSDTGIKGA